MPAHGAYAISTGRSFKARGKVRKSRVMTVEQKKRKEFLDTHKTVVTHDENGKPVIRVEKLDGNN